MNLLMHSLLCLIYSHLQNRLRLLLLKKIQSTDHNQPFLALPMDSTVPGHYIDFGREYFLNTSLNSHISYHPFY